MVKLCANMENNFFVCLWHQADDSMALGSSCHIWKLPNGRGVCREGHHSTWCQSSSFLAPVKTGRIPCICRDLLVAEGQFPLLVMVFCLHIIESSRVLFGFRETDLNRGKKTFFQEQKWKNTKFFWVYSWNFKVQIWLLLALYFPDSEYFNYINSNYPQKAKTQALYSAFLG